jgi:hypothetical protein
MRHAVEVIEVHKVEQLLYFDLISIQTSPCCVHIEQDIKKKLIRKSTKKSSVSQQCS